MDAPVQGKLLVVISIAVAAGLWFFDFTGTVAYVLYGLSIVLFILGLINWSER